MQPGDALLALVRDAATDLVLVAPYIKKVSMERVFAAIPAVVRSVTCVTRWLPEDIAAGVCDLEILDVIASRQGAKLFVHPHLHAKFFRADGNCLAGSANLTLRGLGWITPANLELLISVRSDHPGISEWETALMRAAVPATSELRDQICAQAQQIVGVFSKEAYAHREVGPDDVEPTVPALWIPSCPAPDRLWLVYSGRGADTMVTSAFQAAQADLTNLCIPAGLSSPLFEAYVAGILRGLPIFREIETRAAAGLTDAQAHELLAQKLGTSFPIPPEHSWRTIKAWITHFFGSSYRLQATQEVLVRGRTLQ